MQEMASKIPLLRYQSYHSGGYSFALRGDDDEEQADMAMNATRLLQEGAWIDASTRAVFVELFVYSVAKDRLSHVMLAAQFTPSMQVCAYVCMYVCMYAYVRCVYQSCLRGAVCVQCCEG